MVLCRLCRGIDVRGSMYSGVQLLGRLSQYSHRVVRHHSRAFPHSVQLHQTSVTSQMTLHNANGPHRHSGAARTT